MRICLLLLWLCLALSNITAQTDDVKKLETALFNLPDVSFVRQSEPCAFPLKYMLRIRQPLDHADPGKGYFFQRVQLTHHGFEQPVLMQTQGYELFLGKHELENALDANHLNCEHRFFGESLPDTMAWPYLTLEQVAADLHHINTLFRQIYGGVWISSGISKGGQTTIFYAYFYPDDTEVAIPYVAPFNNGLEDRRIYDFLDTVGSQECRDKITAFQEYLLKNEEAALEKLQWYAKGAKLNFHYLGDSLGKAYELAVLEFSFSFWQWGGKCEDIPSGKMSLDSCLTYLLAISNIDFLSDKSMKLYGPHYYQAATQMGYYGYDIQPFKKVLKHFDHNPSAIFAPKESLPVVYDNSLNEKVARWLSEEGNNILYIYGGLDTWSADRITPSPTVNSRSFVLPGKDHGKARVRFMEAEMKQEFVRLLTEWTGLPVNMKALE